MYAHLTKYELLQMLNTSYQKVGSLSCELDRERQKKKNIEDALEKLSTNFVERKF